MAVEIITMLFLAGFVAGGINAIAGGSTLLTFPVLMASGLPPTVANATNFVALVTGNAAAIPASLAELRKNRSEAARLTVASLIGGAVGCWLLIISTDGFFLELVPWLILTATLLFAFGARLNHWVASVSGMQGLVTGIPGYLLVVLFSVYGGYFGAGLGVIMLAVLKIMGYEDFHEANVIKNLTNSVLSVLGVVIYASADLISWPEALIMMAGATLGGYASGYYSKKIPQILLMRAVITLGFCLSIYYFLN